MNSEITGKIIVVGDNIDTDQIYPGCYLALTDPKEIGSHCLSGVDENIAANFPQGGIVVAGRNFGCGSSREHAPIALLNMGLVPVICKGISKKVKEGQTLTLDFVKGVVTVQETGESYPCEALGEQAMKILAAGGIKPLMRARFAKEKAEQKAE